METLPGVDWTSRQREPLCRPLLQRGAGRGRSVIAVLLAPPVDLWQPSLRVVGVNNQSTAVPINDFDQVTAWPLEEVDLSAQEVRVHIARWGTNTADRDTHLDHHGAALAGNGKKRLDRLARIAWAILLCQQWMVPVLDFGGGTAVVPDGMSAVKCMGTVDVIGLKSTVVRFAEWCLVTTEGIDCGIVFKRHDVVR